jgi:general secretion pathway protein L
VAIGLGLAVAAQAPQVNFRRGEFAYRSDYSFLRAKGLHLALSATLILCFAALNAYASLRGLRHEHDLLEARLRKATVEVFGQERTDDLSGILGDLKAGPKGMGQLPIPSLTAFDVLDEMSRVIPPNDKMKLDVLELDIKPKKTFLKATAGSAQQADDLADALGKIECFEEVQKGKGTKVTVTPPAGGFEPTPMGGPGGGGADGDKPKDDKPTELWQFTLNIKTTCP